MTLNGSILDLNRALVSAAAHLCCCISLSLLSELRLTAVCKGRLQNRSNPLEETCVCKLKKNSYSKEVKCKSSILAHTWQNRLHVAHLHCSKASTSVLILPSDITPLDVSLGCLAVSDRRLFSRKDV